MIGIIILNYNTPKLGEIISEYGKSNYGNYLRKVKEGRIRY